jgi:exonuclease VII small subunit
LKHDLESNRHNVVIDERDLTCGDNLSEAIRGYTRSIILCLHCRAVLQAQMGTVTKIEKKRGKTVNA